MNQHENIRGIDYYNQLSSPSEEQKS